MSLDIDILPIELLEHIASYIPYDSRRDFVLSSKIFGKLFTIHQILDHLEFISDRIEFKTTFHFLMIVSGMPKLSYLT